MYPPFSLYPNGAFMMCESVGEFDDNVPLKPNPEYVPEELQSSGEENPYPIIRDAPVAVKPETNNNPLDHMDPVIKVISKLRPVYSTIVKPMLEMPIHYETPELAIQNLEFIRDSASTITNALRKTIGKISGVLTAYEFYGDYIYESFSTHIGTFLKNAQVIQRQGYGSFTYSYDYIPAFTMCYVGNLANTINNTPEILDVNMDGITLANIADTNFSNTFDGLIDMIQCVFEDQDRMIRLEESRSFTIRLEDLINHVRMDLPMTEHECLKHSPYRIYNIPFFRTISPILRKTCQQSYEMLCKISDGVSNVEEYSSNIRLMLARWTNIFALGVAIAMEQATDIREYIANRKAVDAYTEQLLDMLKTVNP